MFNNSPEAVIGETAFGKQAMDVWISFERSAEGMEYADETGDKVSAFIHFMEHSEDDTAYSPEKAVKKGTVDAVFVIAGRAELGVAAERDEFEFATVGAAIHGAP